MPDIFHRLEIAAPPARVYAALATREGLAGWWTTDTAGDSTLGSTLTFRFDDGGPDMKVTALVPDRRVVWECIDGASEWVGTTLSFELVPSGANTYVKFAHRNWREEVDFMGHCSMKWAGFMMSLKALVERGSGRPYPNDVKITTGAA